MHTSRLLPLSFVVLSACNGGGRPAPATIGTELRITADNALDVASAAYRGAFDAVRVAHVVAAVFDLAPPTAGAGPTGAFSRELAGPQGGTAVGSWRDHDGDGRYSTGDAFAVAFAEYAADGLSLTGAVSFEDVRIAGDVPDGLSWLLDARLDVFGLRVIVGDVATVLDGAFRFAREQRATVRLLELEALGDAVVGGRTLTGSSIAARNDYVLDFTMGLFATATLNDPELGGTFTVRTEAPLTGIQVLPDPGYGRLVVAGAAGTWLAVEPLDFFTVEVHVDTDGDGEVDVVLPGEWAAL